MDECGDMGELRLGDSEGEEKYGGSYDTQKKSRKSSLETEHQGWGLKHRRASSYTWACLLIRSLSSLHVPVCIGFKCRGQRGEEASFCPNGFKNQTWHAGCV